MDQTSISRFHNYLKLQVLLTVCGCDVLRRIFRGRYKLYTGNDWMDGKETSQRFCRKNGKTVYKNLDECHKKLMKTGDLEQWDFSLLEAVLLNTTYSATVSKKVQKKIDQANQDILNLGKLRNQIVTTFKRHRIPDLEFIHLWDGILKVLKSLGVPAEDMKKILFCTDLEEIEYSCEGSNLENIREAVSLMEEGNGVARSGDFKEAVDIFTKALQLTGLSSVERSCVLARRSSVNLQFYEFARNRGASEDLNYADLAIEDAELCIRIKPTWWQGYYLAGRGCLLKGGRKKAFTLFNQALSLNPNFEGIKKARDECQKVEDYDEVPPHIVPAKRKDQDSISGNDLADAKRQQKLASWSAVVLAHRLLKGEGMAKNYSHAVRLFAKAACSGNAEAAYNLGFLYLRGEGVPKNEKTAFQYFRLAANSSEDTLELKHVGEVEAMYELGNCWEKGIGTRLNYAKAAHWYTRASQEGYGEASNRLAFLYRDGQGVTRCPQRAVQFWSLAADQGIISAMVTLAYEYVLMGDLDQAQLWYDRAIDRGNQHAKANELIFREAIEAKRQLQEKESRSEAHCFSFKDISVVPAKSDYDPENIFKHCVRGSEKFWVHEIQIMNHAIQGCQYAQRLWKAMKSFAEGLVTLMEILNHDTSHTHDANIELHSEMFHHFSNCFRLNDVVASFLLGVETKLIKITEEFLSKTSPEKQSKLDLDVRVCYAYLLKKTPQIAIFIAESKQRYPHEAYFYEAHSDFLVSERLYRKGMEDAKKGLESNPNNCNLLYNYALFCHLAIKTTGDDLRADELQHGPEISNVIEAYETFLKNAPTGHRMIPECYYAMAQVSILLKKLPQANKYFQTGEKAEKNLLPCFLPYRSLKKEACQEVLCKEKDEKSSYVGGMLNKVNLKPPEIDVDMKLQLTNPKRCAIVIKHREKINYFSKDLKKKAHFKNYGSEQKAPPSLNCGCPKDVTFRQMDPTKDQMYKDCFINLVIMEDSVFDHLLCVHSVVRDDNGDFKFIYFNNMEPNIPRKYLGFGAKITIFNPYHCSNVEGSPGIWIDDPKSIFYQWTGDDKPLCRFCWMENPAHTCSHCKRAQYCSRECQSRDWKFLKHKLICSPTSTTETDMKIQDKS